MNYLVMISLMVCWGIFVVSMGVCIGIGLSNRAPLAEILLSALDISSKLVFVIGSGIFLVVGLAWLMGIV